MLAAISPVALPALRIAATFFLIVNIVGGTDATASSIAIRMSTMMSQPCAN